MRRILLEEGTGVVEALKAIRGPLFGLFLVAIDTGDSKAAAARALERHPEARAVVAAVFRRAGLRVAAEMGAPATKVIEAQPTHA